MSWPEVKAWRRATRGKLIAARLAVPAPLRSQWTEKIASCLRPLLDEAPAPISFYWPFKAEPDLRPLMRELDARGVVVALPVAIRLGEPMTFRPWTRGAAMERGIWNIPIPATSRTVAPRTLIAPVVGFDDKRYRLGYGGGFFDRTLAKLGTEASALGVGFSMFKLPTIHPQAHDVAMAQIVTEASASAHQDRTSPVCYAEMAGTDYTGHLSDAELAEEIRSIAAAVPPDKLPLLDLVLWKLTGGGGSGEAAVVRHADPAERLSRILPRIRDDAMYAAVRTLRDLLESECARSDK